MDIIGKRRKNRDVKKETCETDEVADADKDVKTTTPLKGRRVGGGWEISSVLLAQAAEKLKIETRKEHDRKAKIRLAELAKQVEETGGSDDGDASTASPFRSRAGSHPSELTQETPPPPPPPLTKFVLPSEAVGQPFVLYLDPTKIADTQCTEFFSSRDEFEGRMSISRSFSKEVRHSSSLRVPVVDPAAAEAATTPARCGLIAPIPADELLRSVAVSCIGIKSDAQRKILERILVSRISQEIFAAVFSFVFGSVFRKRHISLVGDVLSEFPRQFAELQWKYHGNPEAMDNFLWCIAHAVCLGIQRTSAAREKPRLQFTESFVIRIYAIVHILFTGMQGTVSYLVGIRNKLFDPSMLHVDAATTKSKTRTIDILTGQVEGPQGRRDHPTQLKMALDRVERRLSLRNESSPERDEGLNGSPGAGSPVTSNGPQSRQVRTRKAATFKTCKPRGATQTEVPLDDERVLERSGKQLGGVVLDHATQRGRITLFLRASSPSGALRGALPDKEAVEQRQLDILELMHPLQLLEVRSPRCHQDTELIARKVFRSFQAAQGQQTESGADGISKNGSRSAQSRTTAAAGHHSFFSEPPSIYDCAALHEGLSSFNATRHIRLSTPMAGSIRAKRKRASSAQDQSILLALPDTTDRPATDSTSLQQTVSTLENDSILLRTVFIDDRSALLPLVDPIEAENDKCIAHLAQFLELPSPKDPAVAGAQSPLPVRHVEASQHPPSFMHGDRSGIASWKAGVSIPPPRNALGRWTSSRLSSGPKSSKLLPAVGKSFRLCDLAYAASPSAANGKDVLPTDLRETVGGNVASRIDMNSLSEALRGVVRRPRIVPQWNTIHHDVPRSRVKVLDARAIAARVDEEKQRYVAEKNLREAAWAREMRESAEANRESMRELEIIKRDPVKRSEFTNELVRSGKHLPNLDRRTQAHLLQGTFLAESAKTNANEVRSIIRTLEAKWALLHRTTQRRKHTF